MLLHEPGERWTYGVSIDWLGLVVEQRHGKRLGEVFKEKIFAPLDMVDIGLSMSDSMKSRRVTIHDRAMDGIFPNDASIVRLVGAMTYFEREFSIG